MEKQRPQASPAPSPGDDPKASWLTAAVKPFAVFPQARLTLQGKAPYSEGLYIPGDPHPV